MMKYKVGDKVEIRTWEEMKKEYGVNSDGNIRGHVRKDVFINKMERELNNDFPGRVLTVRGVYEAHYTMEEMIWIWHDYMIKEPEKCIFFDSIQDRFELMEFE